MSRSSKPDSTLRLMKKPVTYPIRAVSLMTGVSIDTLRAWERRYGAVTPVRDDRGRVYTDTEVRRIKLLRDAVEKGHAIGRVANMSDEQLAALASTATEIVGAGRAERTRPVVINMETIIEALERFDATTVETELARAAALLRAPDLLRDVIVPVLAEIGDRWHRGQSRIAHEHMLSASVRSVLGSLLRVHQKSGVPDRMLFATPSGERHEFGTLGAALLAASGGIGIIYLGPDMPADDILAVTTTVSGLEVVVLGVSEAADRQQTNREFDLIASRLGPHIELWLGGRGSEEMAKRLKGRAIALPTYEALEDQLVRIGARF